MNDEYRTIVAESRAETKVLGSRFIASALPILTKSDAEQYIGRTRREFWDATHNCFAFRHGLDGMEFRCNDDGEPSGSAGKPILAAIDKLELTDVVVVVTRFFGGTKLGVGGLVRAYGDAALLALERAGFQTKYSVATIKVSYAHMHISDVMHVVSQLGAKIVNTIYDEQVHATLEIRRSKIEELKTALINQTHGRIGMNTSGQ